MYMSTTEIISYIAEHTVRLFDLPIESIDSIKSELSGLNAEELAEKIQVLTEYEQRKSLRYTTFLSQMQIAEHNALELKERE